jgi:hypothetical protein
MSRILILLLLVCISSSFAGAKDKPRPLPAQVLNAQTIFVAIDPYAGEPLSDPHANSSAREDVEKALTEWGRFRLVMEPSTADLILSVRKGTGRNATPTINRSPIDNRPVILQPGGEGGIRIGGQQGRPPGLGTGQTARGPHMGSEIGPSEDSVALYLGGIDRPYPLDSPSLWRYTAKDALHPPKIAAIDQLRKAIAESEKAQQQQKKP